MHRKHKTRHYHLELCRTLYHASMVVIHVGKGRAHYYWHLFPRMDEHMYWPTLATKPPYLVYTKYIYNNENKLLWISYIYKIYL